MTTIAERSFEQQWPVGHMSHAHESDFMGGGSDLPHLSGNHDGVPPKFAKDTAEDMNTLVSDDSEGVLEALVGQETVVRSKLAEQVMEEVISITAGQETSVGPDSELTSSFVMPEIRIAREGSDTELPEGVNGAFIAPREGLEQEGGVILISEGVLEMPKGMDVLDFPLDSPQVQDVLFEELGEAIGVYAEEQGLEIAPGDVGARLLKLQADPEAELTEADFVVNDDSDGETADNDLTTVTLDGVVYDTEVFAAGEDLTTTTALTEIAFSDLEFSGGATVSSVYPDDPKSGGYITAQLTDAQAETYTAAIWDRTGQADTGNVWAYDLMLAINAIGGETTTVGEVWDMGRIVDQSLIDVETPNTKVTAQFTREEVKALIKSGVLQFDATSMGAAPSNAYVDFSKMVSYTDPNDATASPQTLADIILDNYSTSEGTQLAIHRMGNAMEEFFGIPMTEEGVYSEAGETLGRQYRDYLAEAGQTTNDANSWVGVDSDVLNNFLANDSESVSSVLIAKDDTSTTSEYSWAIKSDAAGTVDPAEDTIPESDTDYSAADIQSPNNDFFALDADGTRTDSWVTGMLNKTVTYSNAITDYKDEVTNLDTSYTIASTDVDGAITEYTNYIEDTVAQLNLITTEAAEAGSLSTHKAQINGFTYTEPTFVNATVRRNMEDAGSAMQLKGAELAETLAGLSKQMGGIIEGEHGTLVTQEQAAKLDLALTSLGMFLDVSTIAMGGFKLIEGALDAASKKAAGAAGKLTKDQIKTSTEFIDKAVKSSDFTNLSEADFKNLFSPILLNDVFVNSQETIVDAVTLAAYVAGTVSSTTGNAYLLSKRIVAYLETQFAADAVEVPTYLQDMLTNLAGTETDEATNFYSDMYSAGFESEISSFEAGMSVASLATQWSTNDMTVVSTLQALNDSDGNSVRISVPAGGRFNTKMTNAYDMTDETYALRSLGYEVSRGGQWLAQATTSTPDDLEALGYSSGYTGRMEWIDDQIEIYGANAFNDDGTLLTDASSTPEWGSTDMNFTDQFKVADGAERKGFVLFGGVETGGLGYSSNDLQNFTTRDDTQDDALDALYAAVGVDSFTMEFV